MTVINDLTGQTFGRLDVIRITEDRDYSGSVIYKCRCTCPAENIVNVSAKNLKSGNTKSCGCWRIDSAKLQGLAAKKHGASKSINTKGGDQLDYVIWRGIKDRCYSKGHEHYASYGGRGIKMNQKWHKDFTLFAAYIRTLENCPDEELLVSRLKGRRLKMTIDRINNDGNYEPGNIRWATKKQQANNKKTNIIVRYKEDTGTLKKYQKSTRLYRIKQYGEGLERKVGV